MRCRGLYGDCVTHRVHSVLFLKVDEKGEVIEQALGQDRHAPRRRRLRCSPSYLIRWSVGDFLAMAVLMIAISILELLVLGI